MSTCRRWSFRLLFAERYLGGAEEVVARRVGLASMREIAAWLALRPHLMPSARS